MGLFDDLATGLEGIANAAVAVAPQVLNYFGVKQQQKAQQKAAKSMFSTMPRLGMGYAAAPIAANVYGGYGSSVYGPTQGGSMDTGNPFYTPDSPVGQVINYLSGPSGAVARPRGVSGPFPCTDPMSGQTVMVRKLGRPMLWSGDLAAARRVKRVAAKLGAFRAHHRFR